MKTIIVYGSSTGTTKDIADRIAEKFGVAADDVRDAADFDAEDVANYDLLIFGSSTWDDGELQDDWSDLVEDIADQDLSGKKVALFGCGDSEGYGDTFCDAVGILKAACLIAAASLFSSNPRDYFFFSSSRISRSSWISSGVGAGSAGFSSSFFLKLLTALTTKKIAQAMIRKSTTVWIN